MASIKHTNQWYAARVLMGHYGNGKERRKRLEAERVNYDAVQSIVNALVNDTALLDDAKYLEVNCDMSVYDGIKLKLKGGN